MADYPDLTQHIGTVRNTMAGIRGGRAVSGKPRFQRFTTQDWYTFRVLHQVDDAGLATLTAHYAAHRMLAFDFEFTATGDVYRTQYGACFNAQPLEGGDRWLVEGLLIGTGRLPYGVAVLSAVTAISAVGESSTHGAVVTVAVASAVTVAKRRTATKAVTVAATGSITATKRRTARVAATVSCSSAIVCTGTNP